MDVDARFRAAHAAHARGELAEAERGYKALAQASPLFAWHNLGVLYSRSHRAELAEAAFRTALSFDPARPEPQHSLGMLLLREGRYAEAWPLMEARRRVPGLSIPQPQVGCPEWRGEDLRGKRLLVYPEQGFGDQIQMFRFLRRLAAEGARVTYVCPQPLAPLFEGYEVRLAPALPGAPIPDGDYWTLMMSTPLHLRLTLGEVTGEPYLRAPPADGAGGVGVVAAGSGAHANDAHRSLRGADAERLSRLGRDLSPESTGAADFAATARIIAGLDLVICVDTALAHLAGALGKPVWVLLPFFETDWRWGREGSTTPWYDSARLFRQPAPGAWGCVLDEVEAALAEFRASW